MTDLQKRTAEAIVNIFETGLIRGDYGALTLEPGDSGHLSYGRSQASLGSGNLYLLLRSYCDLGGSCAAGLAPYLDRLRRRDTSLDHDEGLREILERASADPVMRKTQDEFFDRVYFTPACNAAAAASLVTPLGSTVVYDSFIQGGYGAVRQMVLARLGPVRSAVAEAQWLACYVDLRRQWLAGHAGPLAATTYRMDAFRRLMDENKWQLELPLAVRGVDIDEAALDGGPRTLRLETPYMTGADVAALQTALVARGFGHTADGVFGPATDKLVRAFQESRGIPADGAVNARTRAALGL